MKVALLPVGEPPKALVEDLAGALRDAGLEILLLKGKPVPRGAHDRRRDQYDAEKFLNLARRVADGYVLAVTDVDLYARPLNFVFGQAEMGGQAAVISLARLGSVDRDLLLLRAVKEAVHELGHNRGLDHCDRATCVMHFSRHLADTDRKGPGLCPACAGRFGVPLALEEPA